MQPTLLIDEADTFLKNNDELRGILNSGHNRSTACVTRLVGDDHTPKSFSTWAPKAIALIGNLPSTLADRCVSIKMRRKGANEKVDVVRADRMGRFMKPRQCAIRWSKDNLAVLTTSDPALPEGFNDRTADNWRPLLAIADAAGGKWPELARKTMALLNREEADEGAGVGLLRDVRGLFEKWGKPYILSSEVVLRLGELEERPWGEWNRGKPITPRQVARLLGPYDIRSKNFRVGQNCVHKGYARADFEDAFSRYIPDVTATPLQEPEVIECSESEVKTGGFEIIEKKRKTPPEPCCSAVAALERENPCKGDTYFDHPHDELVPVE